MKIWKLIFYIKTWRIKKKKNDTWWIHLNGFTKPCTLWPKNDLTVGGDFWCQLAGSPKTIKNSFFYTSYNHIRFSLDVMIPITFSNSNHFLTRLSSRSWSFVVQLLLNLSRVVLNFGFINPNMSNGLRDGIGPGS